MSTLSGLGKILHVRVTSLDPGNAGSGVMKYQPSTCMTTARQTQLHAKY